MVPALRSQVSHLTWPGMPNPEGAQLLAMLDQLEQTQWWSPDVLWHHQQQQLQVLLQHACQTSPFYQSRILACLNPQEPFTLEQWQQLPLLTRQDLRKAGDSIYSQQPPAAHGQIHTNQTSGSTGEPVKVRGTELTNFFWRAFTLREHRWHQRDFGAKLAVIRAAGAGKSLGEPPDGLTLANWGVPVSLLYNTGPACALDIGTDIKVQAQWLQKQNPDYLLTYPSNLSALLDHCASAGITLERLKQVRTIGEMLAAEIREKCHRVWQVPIVDAYSSQEIGYIALQCPSCDRYHTLSEGLFVEVLDEHNRPCRPGEIGRLVLTSLINFATPLIRYEIQDYAQVADPCTCGRGLMTLERIVGRERNLITLPTGERYWPMTGFKKFNEIAPIRQYQLVQKTLTTLEVRLVSEQPLSKTQEQQLTAAIHEAVKYPFDLDFQYFPVLAKKANGKFEEFISEVQV
jgi:phenylacetate-CoA ligase